MRKEAGRIARRAVLQHIHLTHANATELLPQRPTKINVKLPTRPLPHERRALPKSLAKRRGDFTTNLKRIRANARPHRRRELRRAQRSKPLDSPLRNPRDTPTPPRMHRRDANHAAA
jgi:hypothetical protein